VLLVLAVVWGVVGFSWLRSRARATFGDPVGAFRRHLNVLEHTAPATVQPANRLRLGATLPGSGIAGPRATAISRLSDPELGRATRPGVRPGVPRQSSAAAMRRRQMLKRRRDVLVALVAGAGGTLLLGLVPGLHKLLLLQLIFDLALAGYVSLLVRLRNLAAERDRKLAYLPRTTPADLTRAATARSQTRETPGRAAQAGRRRAAGGFDRLAGYDPGRYDEVAMRRVAIN
jgi:predicted lipid-binding transport protein (Tim44 family)